ncbi:hypothetical protein Tco_1502579 [Tanacetum coccineum]
MSDKQPAPEEMIVFSQWLSLAYEWLSLPYENSYALCMSKMREMGVSCYKRKYNCESYDKLTREVARLLALPTSPPSPLTPLSSPLPQIPSPPLPDESCITPLLLPSTSYRTDIPEVEMLPRKRACFTTPAFGFEVGESSTAGAARQPGLDVAVTDAIAGRPMSREVGYGITDTWDEIVEAMQEITSTTLKGVNQRVTELATIVRQDTNDFYVRFEDAQDDR